ncbi:MAG: hypothetical protein JWO43_484 [Candidatus Adlerbacteria bacterium]|nr:hypothetical protein [Candidatus Adlerbacteria bacterium]
MRIFRKLVVASAIMCGSLVSMSIAPVSAATPKKAPVVKTQAIPANFVAQARRPAGNPYAVPAVVAVSAGLGVLAVENGWFPAKSVLGGVRAGTPFYAGGLAVGIVGAAATLVGYDIFVCKSMGVDPLQTGCRLNWRVDARPSSALGVE